MTCKTLVQREDLVVDLRGLSTPHLRLNLLVALQPHASFVMSVSQEDGGRILHKRFNILATASLDDLGECTPRVRDAAMTDRASHAQCEFLHHLSEVVAIRRARLCPISPSKVCVTSKMPVLLNELLGSFCFVFWWITPKTSNAAK